ncbi:MAG: alginate O-acetyltransferase AlgI [uncultured bacterium]|nr:MAG: alginate O-acetyltransferase AlgI [uncultured bacterium]
MLFTDINFIFIFLPVVLILYWTLKNANARLWVLLISSYIFYGYWNYKFTFLLFITTFVDYAIALKIDGTENKKHKLYYLILSLTSNLSFLGFFKYYNFFTDNLNQVLTQLSMQSFFPVLNIVLPVGISFYIFQSMSYTIDVYRGVVKSTNNFIKFASFVALFPQLVAGPIVRYKDVAEQLNNMSRKFDTYQFTWGLQLFLLGLFKKVLIADHLARNISFFFINYKDIGFLEAWAAFLGYAFQIYFDFSGYSDMAIGLGLLIGLKFPVNFNSPYQALNLADFWRRWHMTLSSWLRDYLYIPLGGNRISNSRTVLNVIIVFTLGGLWHGAAWTFILWGLYQGFFIALYQLTQKYWDKLPCWFARLLTFYIVIISWVLFKSSDLDMVSVMLDKMIFLSGPMYILSGQLTLQILSTCFILYLFVILAPNTNSFKPVKSIPHAMFYAFMFLWSVLEINSLQLEFLYYQF